MSFVKFEKKVVWKCLRKLKVLPWERTEVNWWDVQQMVGPPPSCKDPLACQVSPKYVILTPDNRVSRAAQISKGKHYKERSPKPLSRPFMGRYPPPLFANDFLIGKTSPKGGSGESGGGANKFVAVFHFSFQQCWDDTAKPRVTSETETWEKEVYKSRPLSSCIITFLKYFRVYLLGLTWDPQLGKPG